MSSFNFNIILDSFFTEDFSLEKFNSFFSNNDIKLFFLSVLKEFTPDELIVIFANRKRVNSSLNNTFTRNLKFLLTKHSIKISIRPFNELYFEVIKNEKEGTKDFVDLIYSIASFVVTKKPNHSLQIANSLKQLAFNPEDSRINYSIKLIETIVDEIFKKFDSVVGSIFTYDYVSNALKENNKKISILYYVYYFGFAASSVREKGLVNYDGIYVFQEIFYSNFEFLNLYNKYVNLKQENCFKVENMLVTLTAPIGQFFCGYNLLEFDYDSLRSEDDNSLIIERELKLLFSLKESEDLIVQIWQKIFYINPYKVAKLTLQILSESKESEFNYYDIECLYPSIKESGVSSREVRVRIFVKCLIILYILFNTDMKNYSFLLGADTEKTQISINQFNTIIITTLFNLREENKNLNSVLKQDILLLLSDLIYLHFPSFETLITDNSLFNEKLIKFILNEVESSHVFWKYFDKFLSEEKPPSIILNGFLLIGHWANKYPLRSVYEKIINLLLGFEKTFDLRKILTNYENVNKFIKGIFLLFKAFPKPNDAFKNFVRFLSASIGRYISDYTLGNYSKDQIEKLIRFINVEIVNSNYRNKNTCLIEFNHKKES